LIALGLPIRNIPLLRHYQTDLSTAFLITSVFLAETERLTPDESQAYQQKLFEPLLQHAHRHVPFYVQRLAPLFRGGTLDLDRFQEIPRAANALASGSTGRPFVHRPNQLPIIAGLSLTDRLLRWRDFDGNKTMATFIARHLARAPQYLAASEASRKRVLPAIGYNSTQTVSWQSILGYERNKTGNFVFPSCCKVDFVMPFCHIWIL
jgi:hypothetical protein